VGTLLLAGLLPLALALGVILVGVVELRVQSRGRMHRALAQQQAGHLSSILAQQVELANLVNGMPGTGEFLRKANERPPLSQSEIDAIERRWPGLRADDPLLKACLDNEVAARWSSVARGEPRFAEVMVTDATGRLVAATDKTSDYFQADETWWQLCWNGGRGRVLISDVVFDESAIPPGGDKPGTLVADLCLPIYDDGANPVPRKVVGVCKVSLHATWMLRQLDMAEQFDDVRHAVWLVRSDGRAVPGGDPPPPVADLPSKTARRVAEEASGWLKDPQLKGHELIGFAAVEQSRLMDRVEGQWHVVVASDVHEVAAQVYRLAWKILAAGLIVIAGCFLGGLVIARREVIRPLLTLEHAVDQIANGNREYRLSEARGRRQTFRDDELGRLAEDFNAMAAQLQANLERVEQADALKRQFIDLASHELRTPVTYILGASQLAQRQNGRGNDVAGEVLGKVASKAQRLNRIVENMFKLLAADRFDKAPRWEDVDVAGLVRAVTEEHEPFLRERRQHWRVEVAPDLPTIRGESYKVKDILTNLVSNAIRFSPDGGEVGVRARGVDGGVEIEVSDSGPGIPKKDLPDLFQPFFVGGRDVLDRHSSGDYQHMSRGMGLGLSVVKRFVDLHGGTVSVDTSPEGTRVRVFLPREPTPAPADGPRSIGGASQT
jgi:signal transduction histidine kinase